MCSTYLSDLLRIFECDDMVAVTIVSEVTRYGREVIDVLLNQQHIRELELAEKAVVVLFLRKKHSSPSEERDEIIYLIDAIESQKLNTVRIFTEKLRQERNFVACVCISEDVLTSRRFCMACSSLSTGSSCSLFPCSNSLLIERGTECRQNRDTLLRSKRSSRQTRLGSMWIVLM